MTDRFSFTFLCFFVSTWGVACVGTPSSEEPAKDPQVSLNYLAPDMQERIDRFITSRMQEGRVPGLSVAIIQAGKPVYVRGYGSADLEAGTPMTGRTRVSIGSTAKSMTAAGLMQWVQRAEVDLEAPVTRYLPWFRTADGRQDQILVKHLLAHTSGLPGSFLWDGAADEVALERRVRALAAVPLRSEPGTRWEYSNDGFAIAGLVLQQVSGVPYEEAMARHLFQPLGMTDTTFGGLPAGPQPVAQGYVWTRGEIRAQQQPWSRSHNPAGSALFTSALDTSHYLAALLASSHGRESEALSKASVDEMWRPLVPLYGLGWYVSSMFDRPVVFHRGDVLTSGSSFLLVPGENLAVATLANLDTEAQWEIAEGVAALMLGAEPPPATELPYRAPSTFVPDTSIWQRYTGTYSTVFGAMHVYVEATKLRVAATFSEPPMVMELEPYGDNDFCLRNDLGSLEGAQVEFHSARSGRMEIWMRGAAAGERQPGSP